MVGRSLRSHSLVSCPDSETSPRTKLIRVQLANPQLLSYQILRPPPANARKAPKFKPSDSSPATHQALDGIYTHRIVIPYTPHTPAPAPTSSSAFPSHFTTIYYSPSNRTLKKNPKNRLTESSGPRSPTNYPHDESMMTRSHSSGFCPLTHTHASHHTLPVHPPTNTPHPQLVRARRRRLLVDI